MSDMDYQDGEDADTELSVTPAPSCMSEGEMLRLRILDTLEIYPRLSPSMLQSGIGPHNAPRIWRPILERLILDGTIIRSQESHLSERGRYRTIIVLSLSEAYRAERVKQLKKEAGILTADYDGEVGGPVSQTA